MMPAVARATVVPGCWQVTHGTRDLTTGSTVCFLEQTYVVTGPTGLSESRAIRWQESTPTQWDGVIQEGTADGRVRVVCDQLSGATWESEGATVALARPSAFDATAALARARATPTADEMCRRATRCAVAADAVLGARTFVNNALPSGSLAGCRSEIHGICDTFRGMARVPPEACRE